MQNSSGDSVSLVLTTLDATLTLVFHSPTEFLIKALNILFMCCPKHSSIHVCSFLVVDPGGPPL